MGRECGLSEGVRGYRTERDRWARKLRQGDLRGGFRSTGSVRWVMRIEPIHQHISFWSLHRPWWRIQMRAFYGKLPARVRVVLRPAADLVLVSESCRLLERCEAKPGEAVEGVEAPRPEGAAIERDWPSDLPPTPPKQVEVDLGDDLRPRESGDYFDFFI